MSISRHSYQHNGFTLVELMIAMTLVSLLMTMVYSAFSLAVRGWDGIEAVSTENENMHVLQTFLLRKLSQARPLLEQGDGVSGLVFSGEQRRLRFVATAPGHREVVDGLYVYQLSVENGALDQSLKLHYEPYPVAGNNNINHDRPVTLLHSVRDVDFSYYGRGSGKAELQWHSQWPDKFRLPSLVRISMRQDSTSAVWPALIIPLKAGKKL